MLVPQARTINAGSDAIVLSGSVRIGGYMAFRGRIVAHGGKCNRIGLPYLPEIRFSAFLILRPGSFKFGAPGSFLSSKGLGGV